MIAESTVIGFWCHRPPEWYKAHKPFVPCQATLVLLSSPNFSGKRAFCEDFAYRIFAKLHRSARSNRWVSQAPILLHSLTAATSQRENQRKTIERKQLLQKLRMFFLKGKLADTPKEVLNWRLWYGVFV